MTKGGKQHRKHDQLPPCSQHLLAWMPSPFQRHWAVDKGPGPHPHISRSLAHPCISYQMRHLLATPKSSQMRESPSFTWLESINSLELQIIPCECPKTVGSLSWKDLWSYFLTSHSLTAICFLEHPSPSQFAEPLFIISFSTWWALHMARQFILFYRLERPSIW